MRVLLTLLPLVAASFSAEQEAQRGLLVLPKPDASVTSGFSYQQDASSSYNQQQQTPEILSPEFAARRGVYFVEVPQERVQALQANSQRVYQQDAHNVQASAPAEYKQQTVNQVNVRYLPLEASPSQNQFAASGYGSQYRAQQTASQPIVRYLPIQLGEENYQPAGYNSQYKQQQQQGESTDYSSQYRQQQQQGESTDYSSQYRQQQQQGESTDYNSQYRQQQGEPTGYLASVQYSEVGPIQGPVYSYKPEPLTRILRYAPVY